MQPNPFLMQIRLGGNILGSYSIPETVDDILPDLRFMFGGDREARLLNQLPQPSSRQAIQFFESRPAPIVNRMLFELLLKIPVEMDPGHGFSGE